MKKILFTCNLFLLLHLSSCAPSYMPNLTNAPLLFEKNDYSVAASFSEAGIGLQSAFAISSHIGIMVNASVAPFSKDNFYYLGEAGLGLHNTLGKRNRMHIELFGGAGMGFGRAKNTSSFLGSTPNLTEEGKYLRYFIQPDIGFHFKHFEFAIALRLVQVNYLSFKKDGVDFNELPSEYLYEPAVNLAVGFGGDGFFENKKIFLQFGFSTSFKDDIVFYNGGIIGGLGIIYRNRNYNNGFHK